MNCDASKAFVAWLTFGLLVLAIECQCRDLGTSYRVGDLQADGSAALHARSVAEMQTDSLGIVMRRASRPLTADAEDDDSVPAQLMQKGLVSAFGTPAPDAAPPLPGQGETLQGNTPSPHAQAAPPLPGQGDWWGPTPAPTPSEKYVWFGLTLLTGIIVGLCCAGGIFAWFEYTRRKHQQEKKAMFKDATRTEPPAAGMGLESKDADATNEDLISKPSAAGSAETSTSPIPDHALRSSALSAAPETKAKPVKQSYRAARSQRKKATSEPGAEPTPEGAVDSSQQLAPPAPSTGGVSEADKSDADLTF